MIFDSFSGVGLQRRTETGVKWLKAEADRICRCCPHSSVVNQRNGVPSKLDRQSQFWNLSILLVTPSLSSSVACLKICTLPLPIR